MTRTIELLDRDDFRRGMLDALTIDPAETAVLTIDMQHDYLDRSVGTALLPADVAERLVRDTATLLDICRSAGIPVVHCFVSRRPEEAALGGHSTPYASAGRHAGLSQKASGTKRTTVDRVVGSGADEVMPELVHDGDFLMGTKREMDAFHLTDLDMILGRYLKPEVVIIVGINTDTCVYATTFGASVRGYRPVLIREGVASGRGDDQHEMALEMISRSVGWVLSTEQLEAKLRA